MTKLRYLFTIGTALVFHANFLFSQDKLEALRIEKNIPSETFLASEYFYDLHYIKLESNTKILLGEDLKFQVDSKNIFVSDGEKCLRFDLTGKYLNSIGRLGKGPGEFNIAMDFFTNPNIQRIYILDPYNEKLLEYDYKGIYKQDYHLGFRCLLFEAQNDNSIVAQNMFFSEFGGKKPPHELYIFNLAENVITQRISTELKKKNYGTILTSPVFYKYDGQVKYKNQLINDVYSINLDGKKEFCYKIEEEMKKDDISPSSIFKIQESQQHIFITYAKNNKGYRACYDKKNKTIKNAIVDKKLISEDDKYQYKYAQGISNDIDHTLPFWPEKIVNDTTAIDFHYAYEYSFCNNVNNVLGNVSESDNPIFIVAKIK